MSTASHQATIPDIESVKEYWDRRPCNVRHSRKEVGTEEYFNEVEARKYFVEPHIPGFAEFAKWNGAKVLEVGCGLGTDAVNFARAGADYTGVDLSEASVALARRRFEVFGLSGTIQWCNGELLAESFAPHSFDLVYSFGVIHHTPRPREVFQQIAKVIKPAGTLKCMLYAKNSWKNAMIEAGLDQPEAQSGCPVAFTYTHEDIHQLLSGLFDVTEITQAHIFPYVIEKYVKYEYERQPWFGAMPPEVFAALERSFGWHTLITAKPVHS